MGEDSTENRRDDSGAGEEKDNENSGRCRLIDRDTGRCRLAGQSTV